MPFREKNYKEGTMKRALLTIISSALILVIGIASTVTVAVVGKKVDLEFVDYASTGVYDRDVFLSNPSGVRFAADAQVLHAEDDRYYMYATSDGLGGYGFYCWTSEDLATWSSPSVCFNPSAADWGKGAYWAPEVTESEDENGELVYYLHYSAKLIDGNDSLNRLGVATSSSPGGPFRNMRNGYDGRILRRSVWGDETSAKIAFEGNAIDIHLFRDTDGKLYCYFAELSSSGGYTALRIFGSEMEEDYCTLLTEPVLLLSPLIQDGMQQDWEVENVNEGPEMIKRGDTYYLTYSGNGYVHANYGIGYATSQSPLGPFAKSEANPIIVRNNNIDRPTGTGHHGVLQLDDGEWYSFYHSHIDMNVSTAARQINIARLGWREDGSMYACGPTEVPVLRPVGEYKNLAPLASVSSKKTECDPSVLTDGEINKSGD